MRKVAVAISLTTIFLAIGTIFWYQEGQYLLPTPLPADYRPVPPGKLIRLDTALFTEPASKPLLLHFFNPDCPCSRFNLNHFLALAKKYDSIKFYAVVTDQQKGSSARQMLDDNITVIIDSDEKLARSCGVYSTPQAAILSSNQTLFFRGNYNRARYCTDKNSNYVQMALDSLLSKKNPPIFNPLATNSYGCVLPGNEEGSLTP